MNTDKLFEDAISALEAEIEAVREFPSSELLKAGKLLDKQGGGNQNPVQESEAKEGSGEMQGSRGSRVSGKRESHYRFESIRPSIRFAEKIVARDGEQEWEVSLVSYDNGELILRFPEYIGPEITEVEVEWENDFVLRRTLQELEYLEEAGKPVRKRIGKLFEPDPEPEQEPDPEPKQEPDPEPEQDPKPKQEPEQGPEPRQKPEGVPGSEEIADDGLRNAAQKAAIEKSMQAATLFVWGPPGTGKTATLGFIVANYLRRGKRVLLVSNTNRAVDVGLLSVIDAMEAIGLDIPPDEITRFGEPALVEERLPELTFDRQLEKLRIERQQKAGDWVGFLQRGEELKKQMEERFGEGKRPTRKQKQELELIEKKIEREGGREELEQQLEELLSVNEHVELRRRRVVATTLARLCTSDLFGGLDFDAVVVDEGSMAALPHLMVAASKAAWHRVIVGDPMQLPPIAVTERPEEREFLEKDIFTTVSGADTTESLFGWHDQNPSFTCFFDTQYRLEPTLADIISTVFYEGRLKSCKLSDVGGNSGKRPDGSGPRKAYHLIDTSKYHPILKQRSGERRFQPVNPVHEEVIERLIRKMLNRGVRQEDIGVMVPFRNSVYELRSRLTEAGCRDVEVGTIHTFQGREKAYIIFDTVMSGESRNGRIVHYSVRPLDEEKNGLSVPRLLNVAFSRTRGELFVLADMKHIRRVYSGKFTGRLLAMMNGEEPESPTKR